MKVNNIKIKNESLSAIAETLSDNGYNPDWSSNDRSGDWLVGAYGQWNGTNTDVCEAIKIPNHSIADMVMDCFINECDKPKDIDYINTSWERVIFVKPRYNNLSEDDLNYLYGKEEDEDIE